MSNSCSNDYRFGFNGKENDNEVKGTGNQQDYGFRIYDPRIGRFLSIDPLTKTYPWYTPYQFAGNKPIIAVDMDGLEERIVTYKTDEDDKVILRTLTNKQLDKNGPLGSGTLTVASNKGSAIHNIFSGYKTKIIYSYLDKEGNPQANVLTVEKKDLFSRIFSLKGGYHLTWKDGQGQESRRTDASVESVDIDGLMSTLSDPTATLNGKPLEVMKTLFDIGVVIGESVNRVKDILESGNTETTVPVYSGQEKKPDSIDHPVLDGRTGDTTGAYRAKRGEDPLKGKPIKKSEIKKDK